MYSSTDYKYPTANENRIFHFVLDIDHTLAKGVSKQEDLNIRDYPAIDWLKQKNLVIDAFKPHILHPGAIELVKWLINKFPNSSFSFYSNGLEQRNIPFVTEIIKRACPENFAEVLKRISIYSEQHLVLAGKEEQPKGFHGIMKKDLSLILKPNETLDNVVLIDDDPSYIYPGQERNHLYFKCRSGFLDYDIETDLLEEDYFFEANHVFYSVWIA